ncbi:MAG: hypothetical protein Q9207_004891 [Kuettlingeria erythrocarpa]
MGPQADASSPGSGRPGYGYAQPAHIGHRPPFHGQQPSTASAYGYHPATPFNYSPPTPRHQQTTYFTQPAVATSSGSPYGFHTPAMSGSPNRSFGGHARAKAADYAVNASFEFPQASTGHSGNASGSPPKKTMKHLTCFFFNKFGECKLPEELCLYSHGREGTTGVASAPVHKEPGKPAVAGRNAEKANPAYVHWPTYHGLPTPAPRHTKAAMSQAAQTAAGPSKGAELPEDHGDQVGEEAIKQEGEQIKQEAPDDEETPSSPPSKIPRSTSAPPEPNPESVAEQKEAENQLLRTTIESLTEIIVNMMSNRVSGVKIQNEAFESLITAITALQSDEQDALFKPIATITRSMLKITGSEEDAKKALDEVRVKLVAAGLGGLLTVLDKDFCASAAGHVAGQGAERST